MINLKLSKKYKVKIQNLLKNLDTKQINEFCKVILNTSKNKKIYLFLEMGVVHQLLTTLQTI